MAALVVLICGAIATTTGAVIGWCPVGRGLFVAGLFVFALGVDLARPGDRL